MMLNDKQRQISRLLRSGIVTMGDFHSDTDMREWGKQFCTKVFQLCTDAETIRFIPN